MLIHFVPAPFGKCCLELRLALNQFLISQPDMFIWTKLVETLFGEVGALSLSLSLTYGSILL